MICENCQLAHEGTYGSGRFCSKLCARSYSTKSKRKEINEKVSLKAKGKSHFRGFTGIRKTFSDSDREKALAILHDRAYNTLVNSDYSELSKYQLFKRVKHEQKYSCLHCNNSQWLGKKLTLEIDHINENKLDNSRNNLRALCPNCHSLTPTWRRKK